MRQRLVQEKELVVHEKQPFFSALASRAKNVLTTVFLIRKETISIFSPPRKQGVNLGKNAMPRESDIRSPSRAGRFYPFLSIPYTFMSAPFSHFGIVVVF